MTIKEYLAAPQAGYSDKDAGVIGPVLHKLALSGRASVDDIVAEAAKPRSPLHEYYPADEEQLIRDARRAWARHLANHILIRVETSEGERTMRAFHAIRVEIAEGKEPAQRQYMPVEMVAKQPAYTAQVIEEARRQLGSFVEPLMIMDLDA